MKSVIAAFDTYIAQAQIHPSEIIIDPEFLTEAFKIWARQKQPPIKLNPSAPKDHAHNG